MVKHILSAQQFADRSVLENLFQLVDRFKNAFQFKTNWRYGTDDTLEYPLYLSALKHQHFFVLFYEASTRTRFSFETAILNLSGQVISSENAAQFSSAIKGETLEDTIQVLAQYQPNGIVLRHPHRGAAQRAYEALPSGCQTSIINAGDGDGQHPTQALLDAYTIHQELGHLDNLEIALVGDLLYGRTIHSLLHLFTCFKNIKLYLVAPDLLQLPLEYEQLLQSKNIIYQKLDDIRDIPKSVDIIYATRLQKERFSGASSLTITINKEKYVVDAKVLQRLKPEARILHPLPRTDELSSEIDTDPRAAYFRQAGNGLYVRMALLSTLRGD